MAGEDGHSKKDRMVRLQVPGNFRMLENDKHVLLQKMMRIADWIRFYNEEAQENGHFSEYLEQLQTLVQGPPHTPGNEPVGTMEPSQSLLLAFVENLQRVTEHYNTRWNDFAAWYLRDFLGVKPLSVKGDQVWLAFRKATPGVITIPKQTRFNRKNTEHTLAYSLTTDLHVQDIEIVKAYSICFERNPYHYPASELNFVTAIKTRDLLGQRESVEQSMLFDNEHDTHNNRAVGLRISAPSLLLREGRRVVNMCFESENRDWITKLDEVLETLSLKDPRKQRLKYSLLNNLFYLTISTPTGWSRIENYEIQRKGKENKLIIKFLLSEDFPTTVPCNPEIHHHQSTFPAIQIRLNFDAWLYPYSWIHQLAVQRIIIQTRVEEINNVQVYNELGKIDNSKPFPPFGINTTAGTWMAIGNYEMAIKNTSSINLAVKWNQLPNHPKGLSGNYAAYPGRINNRSFKVHFRFLNDHSWNSVPGKNKYYLFKDADAETMEDIGLNMRVSDQSNFQRISLKKMTPFEGTEPEYLYTIKSRNGFVRMTLEDPEMGFGNQEYRDLFTARMLMKKWRKKHLPALYPPINPQIENITLDYRAEDIIDLRTNNLSKDIQIDQLYPFGVISSAEKNTNNGIPFVFSQENDAGLLLGLKNVQGGEHFSIYLTLAAISNEMTVDDTPKMTLYWGDSYHWEEIPRGFLARDTTRNMLVSGNMVLNFPQHISSKLYDKEGILWIKVGFEKNHEFVPDIRAVYNNAAQAVLDATLTSPELMQSFKNANGPLQPEKKLPGITGIEQITAYYSGQELEDLKSMQARVSEYVTHRGRAVTARDYELLTLQEYPDIGKVLCLPNTNLKNSRQGVVTVVVVPKDTRQAADPNKPMVASGLLNRIEQFLNERASRNALVDVINPVYEELQVKCVIKLTNHEQVVPLESIMKLCDNFIAPWQQTGGLPRFRQAISLKRMYQSIEQIDFVEKILYFAIIRVSQDKTEEDQRNYYHLYEYGMYDDVLLPDQPYKLFVPSDTHLIEVAGKDGSFTPFGLGDMEIGKTFIL